MLCTCVRLTLVLCICVCLVLCTRMYVSSVVYECV